MTLDLVGSFRRAGRGLRRSPGFAALSILTLGVGIGAVTAVFGVVDGVLLRPLPYGEPDRAVMVWSAWREFPQTWVSWDEYELYRSEVPAFEQVALFTLPETATLGGGESPERVVTSAVSASLVPTLGVKLALGRTFLPAEDRPGGERVVLLADSLWRRRFASDPAIVGKTLELDGIRNRIVGVLPPRVRLPTEFASRAPAEVWTPLAVDPADYGAIPGPAVADGGGAHTFFAVARLRPGATTSQANRQLATVISRLARSGIYEQTSGFRVTAVPVPRDVTAGMRPALRVLLGASLLVLLVACADVAGVLLVRGERRRAEVGLRTALGGGWPRLAGQLLAEGLLVGLGGAAAGVLLAHGALQVAKALAPATLPRLDEVAIDLDAYALAVLAGLGTAVMAGAVSLLQAARVDSATLLREGGTRSGGRLSAANGRRALVAAQAALTVVAACAAGLTVRSVGRLLAIDPGFEADGVLTAQLSIPSADYPDRAVIAPTYAELVRRVEAIPGVESAGIVRFLPLAGELGDRGVAVPGYQPQPGESMTAEWQTASPGYFAALRVRAVAGRLPDVRDQPDAPPVAVVNESFARRFFRGRDPVGAPLSIGGEDAPRTIVGVVADTRASSLTADVKPRFYAVYGQGAFRYRMMELVIRTSGSPAELAPALRAVLNGLDPRLATSTIRPLSSLLDAATAQARFTMILLAAFAALALGLGAVGTYGLVAQVAAQREREMGLRVAIGARPRDVLGLIAREGLLSTGVGLALGAVVSALAAPALGGLLYGVAPRDPFALGAALVVVLLAALLASASPAWRASRADPMSALRGE